MDCIHPPLPLPTTEPVGAGLPAMGASASPSKTASIPIAGKPAPTMDRIHPPLPLPTTEPVGAGLPAMAAVASPSKTASIQSLASQLPQWIAFIPHSLCQPLNLWELACQRWRHPLHHPATAQAVPVLARWSLATIPTGPRCCRRRRSRGTGNHPVSRCCPRRSGSSS
ncbi:hypothetical protein PS898_01971 [Pseudomonas fluorescens]|nr:hypothetical protein PS898_01971 [Pseudomonas fluorescens]